jgi:endonuclease YncB( thermonuclease family)
VSKNTKNIWNKDSAFLEKHVRNITFFGDMDYSAQKILAEADKEPKPFGSILEHVFSPTSVVAYVLRLKTQVKMQLVHLYVPQDVPEKLREQGKELISKLLLHKTVGLKFTRVDDNGNLVGRCHFPQGEIASELLKKGLVKLSTPKDSNFDSDYFRELKNAQLIGQSKREGLWKYVDESELMSNKSSVGDFNGKVVEVHSGDSLTVERESDMKTQRLFLSCVKAPSLTGRVGG